MSVPPALSAVFQQSDHSSHVSKGGSWLGWVKSACFYQLLSPLWVYFIYPQTCCVRPSLKTFFLTPLCCLSAICLFFQICLKSFYRDKLCFQHFPVWLLVPTQHWCDFSNKAVPGLIRSQSLTFFMCVFHHLSKNQFQTGSKQVPGNHQLPAQLYRGQS